MKNMRTHWAERAKDEIEILYTVGNLENIVAVF